MQDCKKSLFCCVTLDSLDHRVFLKKRKELLVSKKENEATELEIENPSMTDIPSMRELKHELSALPSYSREDTLDMRRMRIISAAQRRQVSQDSLHPDI